MLGEEGHADVLCGGSEGEDRETEDRSVCFVVGKEIAVPGLRRNRFQPFKYLAGLCCPIVPACWISMEK